MKNNQIYDLSLVLEDFYKQEVPTPDDLCKTLADFFKLSIILIFRSTEEDETIRFSRIGLYYKETTKVLVEISFDDIPERCQEFWNSDGDISAIHGPDQEKVIKDLSKKLNVPCINQFGLIKFDWGGDREKTHFMIAGVETKVGDSIEPFFTNINLKPIRNIAQSLTSHLANKCGELQKWLDNFDTMRVRRSRTGLKWAAEKIVKFPDLKKQLEICSDKTATSTREDYIWSTYLDMKTALHIIPGQDTEDHPSRPNGDEYPLTNLARIRSRRLEKPNKHLCTRKDKQSVQKIWTKLVESKPNESHPGVPVIFPENNQLPCEPVKKCHQFVKKNWLALELIRTRFFCLHHTARHTHPAWGVSSVENLQNSIIFKKTSGKNLIALTSELLQDFLVLWQEDKRLVMTSDWLAAWFGLKLLRSSLLKKETQKRIYSPNELAKFYEYLGCYFLYILHWIRNGGDTTAFKFSDSEKGYEEVVESTLYLLSEYAHVDLKLPRRVNLFSALKGMWASEAVLYTVHHTYREHLHHSIDLCLMGLLLIESGLVDLSRAEDKRNWVLAALLHDIGYGLNLNRLILDHLSFLETCPDLKDYLQNLQKALEIHEDELIEKTQRRMPGHQIKKVDHGVISAMFVFDLYRPLSDQEDSDWLADIQPALKAIIRHNLPNDMVDPSEEPLSFLLLLCDHLQEWDRPRVDRRFCYYLSSHLLRTPGHPPSTSTLIKYVKVNLRWKQNEMKWLLPSGDLEFDFLFKDASLENFEPVMIWCSHSFDLQKVDCEKLKQKVRLIFRLFQADFRTGKIG